MKTNFEERIWPNITRINWNKMWKQTNRSELRYCALNRNYISMKWRRLWFSNRISHSIVEKFFRKIYLLNDLLLIGVSRKWIGWFLLMTDDRRRAYGSLQFTAHDHCLRFANINISISRGWARSTPNNSQINNSNDIFGWFFLIKWAHFIDCESGGDGVYLRNNMGGSLN